MGTHCLTRVFEDKLDEVPLVAILRPSDGYVAAHGHSLARLLAGTTLVQGLKFNEGKVANGMSCLAATVVAHFKVGPGSIYLQPATASTRYPYVYDVRGATGEPIQVTVQHHGKKIFEGTPEQLLTFSESDDT